MELICPISFWLVLGSFEVVSSQHISVRTYLSGMMKFAVPGILSAACKAPGVPGISPRLFGPTARSLGSGKEPVNKVV